MGLGHHRAVACAMCDGYRRTGLLEALAQAGVDADSVSPKQ
jgi:hypothetical protein